MFRRFNLGLTAGKKVVKQYLSLDYRNKEVILKLVEGQTEM